MYKVTIRGVTATPSALTFTGAKLPLIKFVQQLPRYLKHMENNSDLSNYDPSSIAVDGLSLLQAKDIVEYTMPLYIKDWKYNSLISIVNEFNNLALMGMPEPGYNTPLPMVMIAVQLDHIKDEGFIIL